MLEPGRLWKRLTDVSAAALRNGAQLPVPTEYTLMEGEGISFIVRILAALEKAAPSLRSTYREMGLQTIPVALAKGRINQERAEELRALLQPLS